ncbi:MAG: phosphate ABC transporter permease subunit PstC [Methanomassiliicoccales archaeon]|jgi:phosphate ABC transporter permease protein PstC/phosphate ABC transporter permease subunit PstA
MIDENRKSIYLFSLQISSFVLLSFYSIGMDHTLLLPSILFAIEIIILATARKGFRPFILLWQAQLFLVAFDGIIFYPSIFFNLSTVKTTIQMAFASVILFIEIIVLIVYRYKERGIIWTLKGSAVSLIAIVILVLLIIVSEGLPGFVGNDPVRMLTTTGFAPYNQPDSISKSNLAVRVDPYDYKFGTSSSIYHLAPSSNGSFNLTLSNIGALNDSYAVSFTNDPGLNVNISSQEFQLDFGESLNIEVLINSTSEGNYSLYFLSLDKMNIRRESSVQVIVSTIGFNFKINRNEITMSNQGSSNTLVPIGIENAGTSVDSCILRISAPSGFSPSLGLSEWSYSNGSATISLDPGEMRNFTLIPRQLMTVGGTYQFIMTASAVSGNQILAVLNLTLSITNNQIINAVKPGPIPLSLGNTSCWNISVYNQGIQKMLFNIPDVPNGLNIRAFVNGATEVPIKNGAVLFDNVSTTQIELIITMVNDDLQDNSSFDVVMTTPGSSLQFGLLGIITGSAISTLFALIFAVPLALACAVFLSEYCSRKFQRIIKPVMEILAGIPSVIFGLWGALTFGPFLVGSLYPLIDNTLGVVIPFFHGPSGLSARSLMTASVVLGIMIFPIIMSLSYEAIAAVPSELKEGSISLGATRWQTIRQIVFKKARPGILGSIILGTGRALGETMAVLMILGFTSTIPNSVFDTTGTMTSAIATTLTGVFSTTQARQGIFAIALLLFVFVLILNFVFMIVTREGFWSGRRLEGLIIKVKRTLVRGRTRTLLSGTKKKKQSESRDDKNLFLPSKVLERRDKIATAALYLAAAIMMIIVGYIISDIIIRGGLAFQGTYLTETQLNGGFLNSVTGSLMLVGVALAAAVPITILAAVYVHEYTVPNSRLSRATYISVSTLSSTPSIIFGAFGFMVFILYLNFGFSLFSAGLTLACMILPFLYISNIDALRNVPDSHKEASYALGITKWKTITGIVLPSSLPAISSGVFISIGRAIGETAAVLLTAGFIIDITTSIAQPVASMPVMIYNMFSSSAGDSVKMEQVYAAAFLLIVIVIVLNLAGKMISHYYQKSHHGLK